MRVDAVRRREALLREARRLFAEVGTDVALDVVAEAAGVGIATLYRNFESRAALVEEVALAILRDLRDATTAARAEFADAPARTWEGFVRNVVALDLGALTSAMAQDLAGELDGRILAAQDDTLAAVEALLGDARSAGLVPEDLGALELVVTLAVVTRPQPEAVRRAAPDAADRLVAVVLAGLRAQALAR
ncbi:TetR/AcrR family transcriptional regulator [Actinotalea sp. JY-7876]|uniref:TetR/AcrR family transcriptional regulator n=1 Tax=Actinotalea sp. JY-7876 TaxID=2758442 RepID=UPI0015F4BDC0|nr:TetR/AcrR family transcriptional regulator [Actinotalea sp. JY-7876]